MYIDMLNNVCIGRYYSTSSNVHKMHPISKIVCTFLFILMALVAINLKMLVGLILVVLLMVFNTNIPLKIYYNILYNLKVVLIIIFLLFSLVSLSFYFGFIVLLKVILIIIYLAILTLTTPPTEIIYGLERFLYPLNRFRLESNVLALNIGLSLRFVSSLIDTRNNILKSQISRGIDYRRGISDYILAMRTMMKSVFVISIRKAKNLKESMMIRLYSIDRERCNFRINKWGFFDNLLIVMHSVLLIIIILKGVIL